MCWSRYAMLRESNGAPCEAEGYAAPFVAEAPQTGGWLVLHDLMLFPRNVERAVAAGAANHVQPLAQGHALATVGADAVFRHAGEAGRILGTWHDGPAARRLAHDLQVRARNAHALAHDVDDRLARPQLLHVVPGTPAERIIDVGGP